MQRYICKDCGKIFSENYGDNLRYSHLSESQWKTILRGLVYDHILPMIAKDADIAVSIACARKAKVNQAIQHCMDTVICLKEVHKRMNIIVGLYIKAVIKE